MAEFPALPLWTDAYLADTGHLTTIEHGAYFLLLMTMWRAGGSLPNDDKKLARYARMTPAQWKRVKDTMLEFFTIENDELFQSRLTDELVYVRQRSKRQSENARSKSRKTKHSTKAMAEPKDKMAEPNGSHSEAPTPTPTPIEIDTNVSIVSAFDLWNEFANENGLSVATILTPKRKTAIRQRLKECDGIDGWKEALQLVSQSPFLMGENNRNFKASLDFLCQQSSFVKLMEGTYTPKQGAKHNGKQAPEDLSTLFGAITEFYEDDERNQGQDSEASGGIIRSLPSDTAR